MKYFNLKTFILLLLVLIYVGCEKDTTTNIKNDQSEYLTVQKLGVGTMASLDPELIQVIKGQMVEQGRAQDTARLLNTYNAKTGKLLVEIKDAVYDAPFVKQENVIDSTQIKENNDTVDSNLKSIPLPWDHYYLKVKAHLAGQGWTGPNCGPVGAWVFVGTRGQSLRMEAFVLSHDNIDPMVIPDIRYQVSTAESGWLLEQTWGGVAGTTGIKNTVIYLKIRSATPGYTTRYMVHQEGYGDSPIYYNGAVAGPLVRKRIEGMMLDIYAW